ncbi:hypothetical protein LZL87_005915 [Fusarium oxysporum]|nr:hypothetical protein LZL87_005915 [Fusarium oxysporum]
MTSSNPSGSSIPGPWPSQVSVPENETQPEGHKLLETHSRSAIQADNIEEIEQLLDQNSFLTNVSTCYEVEDNQGPIECQVLPVTIAAKFGPLTILEMLLSNFNADINAPIYSTGISSLHLAAEYGWLVAVRLLLSHGADVNRVNAWEWTSLHYASRNGHTDVAISWLLEKQADIEANGEAGVTPLDMAAGRRSFEAAKVLLSNGANVHAKDNSAKSTAMLYASELLDSRLSLLLQEGGASLSDTDKRGYNCFHRMLENKGGSLQHFLDVTI